MVIEIFCVKFGRKRLLMYIKIQQDIAPSVFDSASQFRRMSREQLENFGVDEVAYVRSMMTERGRAFFVHAADGRPLAVADTEALAAAAIIQSGMLPRLVH
jgi:hypothetical protein